MRRIAVFDTNILISSQISHGKPYQCLELARKRLVDGVTCQEILRELEDKLRHKFVFSGDRVTDILADLLGFLRPVVISSALRVVAADPKDDKVIECAVVADATHVVTGDRRHLLPLRSYRSIQIVSAAEFLAEVATSPEIILEQEQTEETE